MTEFDERLAIVRRRTRGAWTDNRTEEVVRSVAQNRGRRRTPALAYAIVLLVAAAAVLGSISLWPRSPTAGAVILADGTRIVPLSASAAFTTSLGATTVASGAVRFEVKHQSARPFTVSAGPVRVEVLGTVFDVERTPEQVRVTVERGRVRVTTPREVSELHAGQSRKFRVPDLVPSFASALPAVPSGVALPPAVPTVPSSAASRLETPSSGSAKGERAPAPPGADWQSLASRKLYSEAFTALQAEKDRRLGPQELLLAADVARLSGRPAHAVQPLTQFLSLHARDPRAPAAAFTLGRVLEELGDARGAAKRFELAYTSAPRGPFAEDALARAVQSFRQSGQLASAKRLAHDYSVAFPKGRYAAAMKALLGGQ